jgi:dTDP-4-dehydrorhamnose reductase
MLITGGGGRLAHDLIAVFSRGYAIASLSREQLDVTDSESVRRAVWEHQPEVILNTAAYTDVDGAESDRETAFAVNAEGARNVAEAAFECGARLVHFSTDYVFDGNSDRPYVETDRPNPKTVYGQSKLQGEQLVLQVMPEALVLRVAWLYGSAGRNFVTFVVKAVLDNATPSIRVFHDLYGCPTWTHQVALQLEPILRQEISGVMHLAARPETTRYEFALAVLDELGLRIDKVRPISQAEFGSKTPRPRRSSLENGRLNALGLNTMPGWREGLAGFVARHRKDLL